VAGLRGRLCFEWEAYHQLAARSLTRSPATDVEGVAKMLKAKSFARCPMRSIASSSSRTLSVSGSEAITRRSRDTAASNSRPR
jgi:hypothetical protein